MCLETKLPLTKKVTSTNLYSLNVLEIKIKYTKQETVPQETAL